MHSQAEPENERKGHLCFAVSHLAMTCSMRRSATRNCGLTTRRENCFLFVLCRVILGSPNLDIDVRWKGNVRDFLVRSSVVVVAVLGMVSSLHAQSLPFNLGLDSEIRMGYLLGQQTLKGSSQEVADPKFDYRVDHGPSIIVMGATGEVSPVPFFSGRIGGYISVWEYPTANDRSTEFPDASNAKLPWDVTPDLKSWEIAGLVHLSRGGGYRFSAVGGYREEFWDYVGVPTGGQADPAFMRDEFNNHVPFFGLQTALFFPWWKARCEVTGSWFMRQEIFSIVQNRDDYVQYTGTLDSGGQVEVNFEGTATLISNFRLGAYGRYRYQELQGHAIGIENNPGTRRAFKLFTEQNYGVVGLTVNLVF